MKDSEGVMVGQHILIKVKKEKKKTPTLSQSQQESKGGGVTCYSEVIAMVTYSADYYKAESVRFKIRDRPDLSILQKVLSPFLEDPLDLCA